MTTLKKTFFAFVCYFIDFKPEYYIKFVLKKLGL